MKSFFVLFTISAISLLSSQVAKTEEEPPKTAPSQLEGWELTFEDSFDGAKLDYSKWIPKDPWGVVRNDELQAYIIKAFHLEKGILKIRCEDIPAYYDGAKRDYRSGMMTTVKSFEQLYGRFEIRCKIPAGQGLWPAFWLLSTSMEWPPEIDVLEILGEEPDKLYLTHHWAHPTKPGESDSITKEMKGPDYSKGFHTYAVEWEKGELRWYIDGELKHTANKEVPDEPMFMLVNLAVGGWAKEPNESTPFPADSKSTMSKRGKNDK